MQTAPYKFGVVREKTSLDTNLVCETPHLREIVGCLY